MSKIENLIKKIKDAFAPIAQCIGKCYSAEPDPEDDSPIQVKPSRQDSQLQL